MNKKYVIAIISFVAAIIIVVVGYFAYNAFMKPAPETKKQALKLDPVKEATHFSKVAGEQNAYWMRGFPIVWNSVEKVKGDYNWESIDGGMGGKNEYFKGDVYHLAMIWPYANWDQKACHSGEKYKATGHLKEAGEELMMGAPCDMNVYKAFLEKLVERYDGDGTDDMPGLTTPIKYWEIMNEPEMQGGQAGGAGEDLKFFVGTPQEYLAILKVSYETIKKTDPGAKVAHAGMAGMQQQFQDFWNPIMKEAGNYFDIANIHSINTDEWREDMFVTRFKEYLAKYGINKPIWVTEAQFGNLMEKPKDVLEFEKLLARSAVTALASGADKIFFIENWTQWDNPDAYKSKEEQPKDKKESKPKIDLSNNATHKVYINLVAILNKFDKVEKIKEEVILAENEQVQEMGGTSDRIGQFKFTIGNKIFFVLWGNAPLPAEISGQVKVRDIYGTETSVDASQIKLTDSPVFITK